MAFNLGWREGFAGGFREGWVRALQRIENEAGRLANEPIAPFIPDPSPAGLGAEAIRMLHDGAPAGSAPSPTADDEAGALLIEALRAGPVEVRRSPGAGPRPNASGAIGLVHAAAKAHPYRLTWAQVAMLAGRKPSGGHFNSSRKSAIDSGYLRDEGGRVVVTDEGQQLVGWQPGPVDLRELFLEALSEPARKMYRALLDVPRSPEALGRELGMQPRGGHWNSGMATLRRLGLIEGSSILSPAVLPDG